MHRFAPLACILGVLVCTGCSNDSSTLSEEELEQVIETWSEPSEPKLPPEEPRLTGPEGMVIPLPPVVANPEQLSERFLVVLHSSPKPKAMPASLAVLSSHPDLISQVVRASSTWFDGLEPCQEITLIGSFEYRRQATTLARRLEDLGVENQVVQSGRYVGSQEVVEAWCRADHSAATSGCGDARFVEVHDERAWMWIPQPPDPMDAPPAEPAPQPLDGLGVWSNPVEMESPEGYGKDDGWKLYAPISAKSLGKCRVAGFERITRGHPHARYLSQDPPPSAPGCGSPELFAALDCKKAELPDEPLIALPAEHPEPILYTALAPLRDIELEDDAKAIVARSPAFQPAFSRARALAEERSMPLQQLVTLTGYVAPDRKILVIRITLQTGDGVVWCGDDDVRVELVGIHEWTDEGTIGAQVLPFQPLEQAENLGLIDLDADGVPEFLQRRWPDRIQIVDADGEPDCNAPRGYCSCPC